MNTVTEALPFSNTGFWKSSAHRSTENEPFSITNLLKKSSWKIPFGKSGGLRGKILCTLHCSDETIKLQMQYCLPI